MSNHNKVVILVAKKLMLGERDGIYLGERIADALTDAGLLAPDLPEPDECPPDIHTPGWNLGTKYAGVLAGRVWVTDERGWGHPHTPHEIRDAAHKLLAVANAAEGNPQ